MTENEKAIINSDRSTKYVRYEFPDLDIEDITAERIYQESLSLEESIFDGDELRFGMCNGSLFKTRVANSLDDIDNEKMNVYVHYTNEELGELDLEFGKYIVVNTERTSDRRWRDITATDYMSLFDVDVADWYINTMFIDVQAEYTLKQFREALFNYIGVQYEDVTLCNDDFTVKKTISPQSLIGRELLEMICELNGCFGHFDWTGTLRFVTLQYDGSYETINTYKQDGCNYDDYDTPVYTSVLVKDEDGNEIAHYPRTIGNNKYVIENNIFLFGLNAFDTEVVANNLYDNIKYISYRRNTTNVYGRVYMPLGQRYLVRTKTYVDTTEIDTSFYSFVLKRNIEGIQAMFSTLEATGERNQSEGRSLTSDINSLRNRTNVIQANIDSINNRTQMYLIYDNIDPYSIEDNETIIDIQFNTNKKAFVIFHTSVIFTLETNSSEIENIMNFYDGDVSFQFYINDEPVIDYVPKVTYQDGTYTIHLDYSYYNQITDETQDQTFRVVCTVADCVVTIPTYRIHGYLTADGLYLGSGWDGRINVLDEIEYFTLNLPINMTDSVEITTRNEVFNVINQNVNMLSFNNIIPRVQDTIGDILGMVYSTIVNISLLTYTATITNNTFMAGDVITPKMNGVSSVDVAYQGDVTFTVSFDNGTTWKSYVSGQWIEGTSMTVAEIESIPPSAWNNNAQIKATIADDGISNLKELIVEGGTI